MVESHSTKTLRIQQTRLGLAHLSTPKMFRLGAPCGHAQIVPRQAQRQVANNAHPGSTASVSNAAESRLPLEARHQTAQLRIDTVGIISCAHITHIRAGTLLHCYAIPNFSSYRTPYRSLPFPASRILLRRRTTVVINIALQYAAN